MTTPFKHSDPIRMIFHRRQRTGCCLVFPLGSSGVQGYGEERAFHRFRPMSTFKILNALIALELGYTDEAEVIEWDGSPTWSKEQQRPLNLRSALQLSAVWFFQILARRVGSANYRRFLARCEYGNALCGDNVDAFWLDGTLLVSPMEQLAFVSRLAEGKLPFAPAVVAAVQEMLVLSRSDTEILRGKTGYADAPGHHYGWLIGYLETSSPHQTIAFATHIDIQGSHQLTDRREITEECLKTLISGCA